MKFNHKKFSRACEANMWPVIENDRRPMADNITWCDFHTSTSSSSSSSSSTALPTLEAIIIIIQWPSIWNDSMTFISSNQNFSYHLCLFILIIAIFFDIPILISCEMALLSFVKTISGCTIVSAPAPNKRKTGERCFCSCNTSISLSVK